MAHTREHLFAGVTGPGCGPADEIRATPEEDNDPPIARRTGL
ncbi:MAG TPA: hypothetical protein VKJ47_13755 [Candidatus Binatia bacterium]|nr:hypothetical protein [Candidatus Binatia bacterium]